MTLLVIIYLQTLRLDFYKHQEQRSVSVSSETLLDLGHHQSVDTLCILKAKFKVSGGLLQCTHFLTHLSLYKHRTFLKITLHCDIPLPNIFLVNDFAGKTRYQSAFIKSPANPSLLHSYGLFVMPAGICAILKVQQFSHYANAGMFH